MQHCIATLADTDDCATITDDWFMLLDCNIFRGSNNVVKDTF